MDKIKVVFFGIGCRIINGKFNEETWDLFRNGAKAVKCSLDEAFFDKSFFDAIKIPEYHSWFDLGNSIKISGLLDSYQSMIEIRINNKQKQKIFSTDLSNETLLFPLYQTSISKIDNSEHRKGNLTIVEKEIGTISTYIFETDSFSLDKLHFTIHLITLRIDLKFMILSKVEYEGKELISRKSDTLVKEQFVLL